MADVITSDPMAAMQVLRSAGAVCASGAMPLRLQSCPPQQLCSLQGLELCVRAAAEAPPGAVVGAPVSLFSGLGLVLIGVAIGWMLRRP